MKIIATWLIALSLTISPSSMRVRGIPTNYFTSATGQTMGPIGAWSFVSSLTLPSGEQSYLITATIQVPTSAIVACEFEDGPAGVINSPASLMTAGGEVATVLTMQTVATLPGGEDQLGVVCAPQLGSEETVNGNGAIDGPTLGLVTLNALQVNKGD